VEVTGGRFRSTDSVSGNFVTMVVYPSSCVSERGKNMSRVIADETKEPMAPIINKKSGQNVLLLIAWLPCTPSSDNTNSGIENKKR